MSRKPSNPYAKPDRFTLAAKAQGYRARSVFKLSEVDKKLRLLKPGQRVVDLGCFPGSWSQYVIERIGRSGRLVGVDLEGPELAEGTFLVKSALEVTPDELLMSLGGKADVFLSDMAPLTTGITFTDHVRQMELVRAAHALAHRVLAPGGVFFVKVFDGEEVPEFQAELRKTYGKVKRYRPEAVRGNSREFFLLAENHTPGTQNG